MNVRAEISKGRLASRTTSTKLASSWAGTSPVSCAAPTAVWVFVTILDEFGLLAADLASERDQLSERITTLETRRITSQRSTGGACTGDLTRPQWTTFFTSETISRF